jgi:hypothetical protein
VTADEREELRRAIDAVVRAQLAAARQVDPADRALFADDEGRVDRARLARRRARERLARKARERRKAKR